MLLRICMWPRFLLADLESSLRMDAYRMCTLLLNRNRKRKYTIMIIITIRYKQVYVIVREMCMIIMGIGKMVEDFRRTLNLQWYELEPFVARRMRSAASAPSCLLCPAYTYMIVSMCSFQLMRPMHECCYVQTACNSKRNVFKILGVTIVSQTYLYISFLNVQTNGAPKRPHGESRGEILFFSCRPTYFIVYTYN